MEKLKKVENQFERQFGVARVVCSDDSVMLAAICSSNISSCKFTKPHPKFTLKMLATGEPKNEQEF